MTQSVTVLSLWRGLISIPVHTSTISDVTRDAVLEDVRRATGIFPAQILSRSRKRPIAWARQRAMWILRSYTLPHGGHRYSFPQISAAVGLSDHTSALYGVRRHQARLDALERAEAA